VQGKRVNENARWACTIKIKTKITKLASVKLFAQLRKKRIAALRVNVYYASLFTPSTLRVEKNNVRCLCFSCVILIGKGDQKTCSTGEPNILNFERHHGTNDVRKMRVSIKITKVTAWAACFNMDIVAVETRKGYSNYPSFRGVTEFRHNHEWE
jgi:hypothetical protein